MARALIIGYGNPFRSDDGFGWHAAQRIANQITNQLAKEHHDSDVEVIAVHQLTPELAETASHFQLIIFIDAARDLGPGELRCSRIGGGEKREAINTPSFSHVVTPETLFGWTAELYGQFPEGHTIAVGGECFDDGETMSAAMQAAFEPVAERVRVLLAGTARG